MPSDWQPDTLTTPGGAVHQSRRHTPTGIHVVKFHPGFILMSADGLQIARFRLLRTAKDWVHRNGPKNPHPWTHPGVEKWRREDPEAFAHVFRPITAAGPYHLH